MKPIRRSRRKSQKTIAADAAQVEKEIAEAEEAASRYRPLHTGRLEALTLAELDKELALHFIHSIASRHRKKDLSNEADLERGWIWIGLETMTISIRTALAQDADSPLHVNTAELLKKWGATKRHSQAIKDECNSVFHNAVTRTLGNMQIAAPGETPLVKSFSFLTANDAQALALAWYALGSTQFWKAIFGTTGKAGILYRLYHFDYQDTLILQAMKAIGENAGPSKVAEKLDSWGFRWPVPNTAPPEFQKLPPPHRKGQSYRDNCATKLPRENILDIVKQRMARLGIVKQEDRNPK